MDLVSFGGTKNGLMLGEVVLVLNPELDRGLDRLRKTSTQLASKLRFVSAQFIALLESDLWLRNAEHANDMAALLSDGLKDLTEVRISYPVQANAVFVELPPVALRRLHEQFHFYDWDLARGQVRWMTSFDTTTEDVGRLIEATRAALTVA